MVNNFHTVWWLIKVPCMPPPNEGSDGKYHEKDGASSSERLDDYVKTLRPVSLRTDLNSATNYSNSAGTEMSKCKKLIAGFFLLMFS